VSRRGFVLAAVLFALVLLAALASLALFSALQEVRIGRNAAAQAALRGSAEAGIAEALAGWDPATMNGLRPGALARLPALAGPASGAVVEVRRLNEQLVLLRSGASDAVGARQVVQLVARLSGLEVRPAAVRARSADAVIAAAASGADSPPSGWSCPATADTAPGLVLEPGAGDSALFRFGAMDWNGLVARVSSLGTAQDSVRAVYVAGDSELVSGRFVGLLVVEGNLVLRGGVAVNGIVLVHGSLAFGAGGATVSGAVVASQVVALQSVNLSSGALSYSSCSTDLVALAWGYPKPLKNTPVWGVF
jgi:hypothetical protein